MFVALNPKSGKGGGDVLRQLLGKQHRIILPVRIEVSRTTIHDIVVCETVRFGLAIP